MNHRELAVVQGWPETRATLVAWNRSPLRVAGRWVLLSGAIAVALLAAVAAAGTLMRPDPTPLALPGVYRPGTTGDMLAIFGRNLLVLGLHAMACVAGFIAKSALPSSDGPHGAQWRWIHERAGSAAIAFVAGATLFSLCTQSFALGSRLSTLAWQMDVSPVLLLLALTPHALPELIAVFLPLAAWLVAARAQQWGQLLAATIATTALALPVVLAAAAVEVFVTPDVLRALHFV